MYEPEIKPEDMGYNDECSICLMNGDGCRAQLPFSSGYNTGCGGIRKMTEAEQAEYSLKGSVSYK